jgi:hypothetical protein
VGLEVVGNAIKKHFLANADMLSPEPAFRCATVSYSSRQGTDTIRTLSAVASLP